MGSPGWTSDRVQQISNWNGEVTLMCFVEFGQQFDDFACHLKKKKAPPITHYPPACMRSLQ